MKGKIVGKRLKKNRMYIELVRKKCNQKFIIIEHLSKKRENIKMESGHTSAHCGAGGGGC